MPWPSDLYHSAPSGMVTPAFSQSDFSLVWVPLSSPREAKVASGRGNGGEGLGRRCHAFDACRVGGRPDDDEVVVHHVVAGGAVALGDEGIFLRPRMDQDDVGISGLTEFDGLAGGSTATTSTRALNSSSKSGRMASRSPELAVDVVVASRSTWGSSAPHPAADATSTARRDRMTRRERITISSFVVMIAHQNHPGGDGLP